MDRINEGSTSQVTATFKDQSGTVIVPTQVRYRVDCVPNGVQLKGWTIVPAASTVTIILTDADVSMNTTLRIEEHLVTIEALYSGGKLTAEKRFEVRNMQFYP